MDADPFCDARICNFNVRGRCTCPTLILAFDQFGICKVLGEQLLQARARPIYRAIDAAQELIDGS